MPIARHTRHEEQALVLHGVGQGHGTVAADDVDPLGHGRGHAVVFDLLDDQRPDRRLGVVLARRWSASWSGFGRPSGSTAIIFEWASSTYSCTASSTCGARSRVSPAYHTGSPRGHHGRGQPAQQPHGVRSLVEDVLAADGLDRAAVALAEGHAHAVALDQPPALVGDGVGGLQRLQRGVDAAGEVLQPGPEHLAVGEVPQLVALEEVGRPARTSAAGSGDSPAGPAGGVSRRWKISTRPTISRSVRSGPKTRRKSVGLAASSSPNPECGGTSTPLPPTTSGLFSTL